MGCNNGEHDMLIKYHFDFDNIEIGSLIIRI